MNRLLLTVALFACAFLIWTSQRARLEKMRVQNERWTSAAAELHERIQRLDAATQSAEQGIVELRRAIDARQAAISESTRRTLASEQTTLPEPDSSHQGGWPQGAAFFYLPKQYLTNASYKLLESDHLTDEAAALFGMSATEREATDRLFGGLLDQFHRLELQRMEPIAPPQGWVATSGSTGSTGPQFDSALTYRIPDLTSDIGQARTTFAQQLLQAVGPGRAELIAAAADSYLRQNLDDLGTGERIVGFVWQPESDGTHSVWYAQSDAIHGQGSFQRVPENVDPSSQTAYYARLFGVKLPGQ